ncbi:putative quinol monooxygenase [Streptomyces sp. NPDC092296]|uniref:putative quinol monooxygenase n=1 Tax=Streptomyces sp. NPDC092296 TaxID=3366012 RepID=UPI00380CF1B8
MSSGYGLIVRFELRDQAAATGFDALVGRTLVGIRQEEGTLAYVVHSVANEPNVRVFYELYRDRSAFEAHEEQPHTRRFLTEREQYLTGLQVTFVEAETGKGPVCE